MTYEERVRQRAEEFAKEQRTERAKKQYPWERLQKKVRECLIGIYTPLARLSIQREAEAFKTGYGNGMHFDEMKNGSADQDQQRILQSLGLVPKNKEG